MLAKASTTFSPHFSCWWMISCLPDAAQDDAQGSLRRSSSRSRSRRSCCSATPSDGSCVSRIDSFGVCPPTSRCSPAITSGCGRWAGGAALVIEHLARVSPSFCEQLRLLDSTPVPCGQSRETRKRSELAGWAAYGYCASHSRYFWGLRLYLLCAPDGMPISFCLAPANEPEREVALAMLERARERGLLSGGEIIIGDKGFASHEFERSVASLAATFIRPDRRDEKPRFGKLGGIRQWIESINDTLKGQLSLENHGGHIPTGVWARVCQRILALAAGVWHSWTLWEHGLLDAPGRHFINYDH